MRSAHLSVHLPAVVGLRPQSGLPLEFGINRHEQHRGFATRYDKLAVRYDATVQITNINIWLRDLSNRA